MPTTQDIVQKLWNLCHILRDDGITYHEYVTELTYLLFLKMAKETGTDEQIPKGYRWDDVLKKEGVELLEFYKKLLIDLGSKGSALARSASTSSPRSRRSVSTLGIRTRRTRPRECAPSISSAARDTSGRRVRGVSIPQQMAS